MQGLSNVLCFHVPGTLTANLDIRWKAARDGRVKHVSAVTSNDSDATITLGVSTDTDEILASTTIGDSQVPVEKTQSDFASTNETGAYSKGETLVLTVDYDGSSGTAGQNLTVVITTLEG